ncbi:FAST kinase domain-containing protein 4 [Prinia subflava]|uniref:FAST kinase domain-containing protein 4 n=1 Tax=Prinia subflava TaxID=208062 RepID=UPI002FE36761
MDTAGTLRGHCGRDTAGGTLCEPRPADAGADGGPAPAPARKWRRRRVMTQTEAQSGARRCDVRTARLGGGPCAEPGRESSPGCGAEPMAAHLVLRCCRRLLLRAPPAPGAALRTGPPRRAEGPQPRPHEQGPEQQLRELIRGAASPQELLQLGQGPALSSNLAALAIARLARLAALQGTDTAAIRGDPRFQQLLGTLDAQISQVWNTPLVQLLRSLPALGLARGGRQVRSVEQEVLWRLRRLPLRQLVQLAEHLAGQGAEGPLLPEVLRKLELRWTELDGTREVVTLMAKVGHLSPALMERLEDKALELAEQFDPDELRRVALALALQQRRCVPLLRALSYHLLQKPAELPLPVLTDLLFAYSKLSFQQPQVLHRLSLELQPHLGSLSPAQVSRCARSFASLRWLSRPLAEAMAQYCLDNSQKLSLTQLCGVLVSFARLNFQPSSSEEFFSMVHGRLQGQEQQLDVHVLADVVWSLCVLQQPRQPQLRLVLGPDFHSRLRGDTSPRAQSSWLKLLHINATARLEAPGYQGPFLPPELLGGDRDKDKDRARDKEKATPLQRGLWEALPGALGGHDLFRCDVSTVYGWDIDAEVVLDSDNKPLPVRDFAAPHLSHSEGTKPLPPGARRVAVLRWELPQFSSRGRELLGRGSLARRHLRAAGFLLAEVPHYEFLELKLERQRVAYLKDKVAKALASDTAGDTATDTAT